MSEPGNAHTASGSKTANLLAHPAAVGMAPWINFNTAVTPGYAAPDGSQSAALLFEDPSVHQHDLRQEFGPVVGGGIYSLSCYCRAGARHWVHLVLWDHGRADSGGSAWFDLSTGAVGTAKLFGTSAAHLDTRMEDIGNGWFLCELICRVSRIASQDRYTAQIQIATRDGDAFHQGDGTSGILIWSPHVGRSDSAIAALRSQANLLGHSHAIGKSPWEPTGAAIDIGYGSPDGDASAVLLKEGAGIGEHGVQQVVIDVIPGQPYIFSCFCKASFRNWVRLVLWDQGTTNSGASAWFNLSHGTLGLTGPFGDGPTEFVAWMEGVGNGWYRCVMSCVVGQVTAVHGYTAQIQVAPADGVSHYDGDGESGVLIWGAQLEQRRAIRPFVPTGDQASPDTVSDSIVLAPGGRWFRVIAPGTQDVVTYGYNPGGLNNQKLALLGMFLTARRTGARRVVLPEFFSSDSNQGSGRPVPFETVFDLGRMREFAARYDIEIIPSATAGEAGGWEYFRIATSYLALNTAVRNLGPDDFCCDFLRVLEPRMSQSDLGRRLRETVFGERGIQVVLQLRVELDWARYTSASLMPSHSFIEEQELSFLTIIRKTREALGASEAGLFITCDEAYLPYGKKIIRNVVKDDLGIDLVFKSDLLTGPERRDLNRLDLSLLDFEIAVAAPFYVGQSRSTFSNLVGLERYARTRSSVTTHYIYNVKGRGLGQRTDNGAYAVADQAIARRNP